jgi:hypothetical protein
MGRTKYLNKMEQILVVAIVFYGFYSFFKLLSNHSIKKMLIKNNMVDQSEKLIIPETEVEESNTPSLKWGIVGLSTGVGMLIATSLYPLLNSYGESSWQLVRGVIPAIIIIFAALGFLIYFFVSQYMRK